ELLPIARLPQMCSPAASDAKHPLTASRRSRVSALYFARPLYPCAVIVIEYTYACCRRCGSMRLTTADIVFLSGPAKAAEISPDGAGMLPSSLPSGATTWREGPAVT